MAVILVAIVAGAAGVIGSSQMSARAGYYRRVNDFFMDPEAVNQKTDWVDTLLVDIRPQPEYAAGHIAAAVNIPFYGPDGKIPEGRLLKEAVDGVFRQKKDKVIIYGRAAQDEVTLSAAVVMLRAGIDVKVMKTGWREWEIYFNTPPFSVDQLGGKVPLMPESNSQ